MTRSLTLLAALVCAGCITRTNDLPTTGQPVDMQADARTDDAGLIEDADLTDPPAPDQSVPPRPDMGEEIDAAMPPAPEPEPEPETEPGPRWRPDAVAEEQRDHLPLDIVCVDAADYVPEQVTSGRGWAYAWRIDVQPEWSNSAMVERYTDARRPLDTGIPDDVSTTQACMFLPSGGDYLIELIVHDQTVDARIMTAQIRVRAVPNEDIHVELTWDTPGDVDQNDSDGADVDLHVRHPTGRNWAQAPLDCYYANAEPEWGAAGPAGNPSLDIDDVNGAGPEHINLDEPEDTNVLGGMYRVGVDYYRADNFASGGSWGPSTATIRIFLNGELAYEAQREMLGTHHFWTVAGIEWTDGVGRVVEIDQYQDQVP